MDGDARHGTNPLGFKPDAKRAIAATQVKDGSRECGDGLRNGSIDPTVNLAIHGWR